MFDTLSDIVGCIIHSLELLQRIGDWKSGSVFVFVVPFATRCDAFAAHGLGALDRIGVLNKAPVVYRLESP